jgi:hypothetical protein
MRKTKQPFRLFCILLFTSVSISMIYPATWADASSQNLGRCLRQEFDLAGERSAETHHYFMETKLLSYAPDGRRLGVDTYSLQLKYVPAKLAGKNADEITCTKFTIVRGGNPAVTVPALAGWTYAFRNEGNALDDKGQVFGIDHGKFEKLVDSQNRPLPPDVAYFVYNSFIDFHSLVNVFAQRTAAGKGIQDLRTIGQKIIHAAAFTEPPVNLGSQIKPGSVYKNGEVTLEFKGLSLVDDVACALVGYDSGQSSFKMIMQPLANLEITTVGASHYKGDLYIGLETNWVKRAVLDELVVSEAALPAPPNKVTSVIERNVVVRDVTEKEFERE